MGRYSEIGALKILDPEAWASRIKIAMTKAGGRLADAALDLGITERHLFRWLKLPGFEHVERVEMGMPRDGKRGRRAVPKPVVKVKKKRSRRPVDDR